jgi:subtilase family serine protease
VGDGKAHVQFPASDPWVLACGGTTIGNISGQSFDEYVWNDSFVIGGFAGSGATGGGVSAYFPLPSYQQSANVPVSLNGGKAGRGVPDVAANASPNSGYYPIYCQNAAAFGYPNPYTGNGTSASAPLYAGLIAFLNAAATQPGRVPQSDALHAEQQRLSKHTLTTRPRQQFSQRGDGLPRGAGLECVHGLGPHRWKRASIRSDD